jgi:F0F1-type ATP synthase assembly protein I
MSEPSPPSPTPKQPPQRARWFQYTDAASVGIEMVVAITICTIGAYYIERYLTHWAPWTTLIGIVVGCITAGKAVHRAARTYQRSLREQRAKERRHDPPA